MEEESAGFLYRNDARPQVRLISALAEGADRILTNSDNLQLDFDLELQAILPFLQEEYEYDFSATNSLAAPGEGTEQEFRTLLARAVGGDGFPRVLELDSSPNDRHAAYLQCSQVIVQHADLILAVWDESETEHAAPGGTLDTIDKALERDIPVICLSLREEGHVFILEPAPSLLSQKKRNRLNFDSTWLKSYLERTLLFADVPGLVSERQSGIWKPLFDESMSRRLMDYTNESGFRVDAAVESDFDGVSPLVLERTSLLPTKVFDSVQRLFAPNRPVEKLLDAWNLKSNQDSRRIKQVPRPDQLCPEATWPLKQMHAAFARSDQLAVHYARLHRSIFVLIYLLGAMALTIAAAAIYFKNVEIAFIELEASHMLIFLELLALLGILFFWALDRTKRLHDRWIEYRCLAEFIRPAIFLSLLGRTFPINRIRNAEELWARDSLGHGAAARNWTMVYLETVLRYAGLQPARMDTDYLKQCRDWICSRWLDKQIHYHSMNAARMHKLGHNLQRLSFIFFCVTLMLVVAKLAIPDTASVIGAALLVAVLPAWASAGLAIRNHAEFEISAQRSQVMRVKLIKLRKELLSAPLSSDQLARILLKVLDTTLSETADWLQLFEVKETETA